MKSKAQMTKLEKTAWDLSREFDFGAIAKQLNRPLSAIERAYIRADKKNHLRFKQHC